MASFLQSAGTGLLQGVGTSMYQRGQSKMDQEAAKIKAMREANLKRLELEHEDKVREQKWEREDNKAAAEASIKDRLNQRDNKTKLKVAAMKAGGKDDSKLGDIPEDVLNDPMLQRLVTDESGEPVLDLNTMQPVMETNWGEVSQIRDMMTQYGIKDWRQGVLLYKREVKPKLDEQRAQAEYKIIADELANMEPGEAKRKLESRFDRREQEKVLSNLPEPKRKEILMGKKITPKEASPPAGIGPAQPVSIGSYDQRAQENAPTSGLLDIGSSVSDFFKYGPGNPGNPRR